MSFVANTFVRNDSRKDSLGVALQAEPKVYAPPTNFLRITGGVDLMPTYLERQSQAFRGTAFETPAEYAGTDWLGKNVTMEATVADLKLLLTHMFGTPDAQGVITPQDATQWDKNFVMQPLSGQARVTGAGHVQFRDAQTRELTLTVPENRTDFVTAAASMDAAYAVFHPENAPLDGFAPVVPVIPGYSGGLGRLDHKVTFQGQDYCPDGTSTARFYNPVEALPACGETIPGFAPGTDPMGVEFQMGFNRPLPELIDASKTKAFLDYVWKLERNGGLIEVTAKVQVSAREFSTGPGRKRTTATFRARAQTPGVSPFTVKVA